MAITLEDLKSGLSAEELANQAETPPEVQEPTAEVVEPTPEVIPPQEETPVAEVPKVEEPTPEPTPEPVPEPEAIDFTFLNKTLDTKYESIEQLQADLNKPTKELELTELEAKRADLQKKYDENIQNYDLLTEQLDPANLFSEEDMKLAVLRKAIQRWMRQ